MVVFGLFFLVLILIKFSQVTLLCRSLLNVCYGNKNNVGNICMELVCFALQSIFVS